MTKSKNNKKNNRPNEGGRETAYRSEFCDQARKLCLLGATDVELADFFGVCEKTIYNWKNKHPMFLQALKEGKIIADAKVAESLYKRAIGYEHPDVHVSNYKGEITTTPLVKHYPPDTGAAMSWLKNRCGDKWREKSEVEQKMIVVLSEEDMLL